MKENVNIRTVFWDQNPEHHVYYKSISDVFYMIDIDATTATANDSPFTLDMGLLLLCSHGSMELAIDMKRCRLEANQFVVILPGQIIEYFGSDNRRELHGKMIMYSSSFFTSLNFPVNFPLVMYNVEEPVIKLTPDQFKVIGSFCDTIETICDSEIKPYLKEDVLKYLCMSLMFSFKEEIQKFSVQSYDTNRMVSRKFLKILAINFKEHRDLQFYADQLHLSKKYFSVLIKNETGKTASDWIDEFIVLDAKKLLATTDMTIQQISNTMSFANQSFFGKFFKRMTGMSPKAYRKSLLDIN